MRSDNGPPARRYSQVERRNECVDLSVFVGRAAIGLNRIIANLS